MPFQLSPGVNVSEIDLTTVIPAVATTEAAIGGVFRWGPVDKYTLVTSESQLATEYGKPNNNNAETFFTAASYLAYSDSLFVSRAHHSDGVVVQLDGNTVTGGNYILVYDNVATGILSDGSHDILPEYFPEGTTISSVSVADVSDTFTSAAVSNTDVISSTLTNLVEGEKVQVTTSDTLPAGLSELTDYYIINVQSNSFQLSTSFNGAAVDITDSGVGTHTITRSGDTRITLSAAATVTGQNNHEFYDADFSFNAIANTAALGSNSTMSNHIVKNEDHYGAASAAFDANVLYIAKYPGAIGNSLKVSVCDSAAAFNSTVTIANTAATSLSINIGENTGVVETDGNDNDVTAVLNQLSVGDLIKVGNSSIGTQYLEITNIGGVTSGSATITFADNLSISTDVNVASTTAAGAEFERYWGYWGLVDAAPGQSNYVALQGNTAADDELHVVVVDENGEVSGIPGTVLEVFQRLSRGTDVKDSDGASLYYKEVINNRSKFVWFANDRANAASATALNIASSTNNTALNLSFTLGKDIGSEADCNLGDILRAYDVFRSAEDVDISLVLAGKSRGGSTTVNGRIVKDFQLPNYLIDNLATRRKDCVVFVSPERDTCVDNVGDVVQDVVDFRNVLRSTSYAVMDSGYKYMYDKYNDVYRWIPINGDTAGLCAYTDDVRDPWWSPAGFNRGQIKNVVKLAWNPKLPERDLLYKNGVNPIVNFPGQGIVMFGDKTLLSKPSAFDRINVRRLFIVLEKAIATASKFTLFEFNDEFTRSSFVNLVTPYLRDVQGRRGIVDFAVICDETNNTPGVIDRNEFVGDIYIKPSRSINFIQLNFVAVRSGVEFSEVIGNF